MKKFYLSISLAFFFSFTGCTSTTFSERFSPKSTSETAVIEKKTEPEVVSDKETQQELDADAPKEEKNKLYEYFKRLTVSKKDNNTSIKETYQDKFLMEIIKYKDTPYHLGGNSQNGIDCSGFTQQVFNNSLSVGLPRTAHEQYQLGNQIANKDELKMGDLVFFCTRGKNTISHVGIYLGDYCFVHASSSQGVVVSNLNQEYYARRYMGAKRVLNSL